MKREILIYFSTIKNMNMYIEKNKSNPDVIGELARVCFLIIVEAYISQDKEGIYSMAD